MHIVRVWTILELASCSDVSLPFSLTSLPSPSKIIPFVTCFIGSHLMGWDGVQKVQSDLYGSRYADERYL
jgi:hypothetical protein